MGVQDFTRLPLGSLVATTKTVIRCPQCSRNGVLESYKDGTRVCVHAETLVPRGMAPQPIDRCEFAGPRAKFAPGFGRQAGA